MIKNAVSKHSPRSHGVRLRGRQIKIRKQILQKVRNPAAGTNGGRISVHKRGSGWQPQLAA
ncbi:MAG: hypothetical protein E7337_12525 [Clostridiales bacterium]|nr:hypothetical protein [Clostridiales bacterium]